MKINPYESSSNKFDDALSAGRIDSVFIKAPRSNLTRYGCLACSHYLSICLLLLLASSAWAAETNLGNQGNTQLQEDTGDAVTKTCAGFVSRMDDPNIPLFKTCRAMVQTGNDVADNDGPTDDSLGLTQDELAAALQNIATEEFAATETMANELSSNRLNTVITRLIEVRRGFRGGFGIAGYDSEETPALAATSPLYKSGSGERGGSAGEDDIWGRWGVFLNGIYGTGDRDETLRTNEFDFDTYGFTTGADYRFTDQFILGAGFTYYDIDTDFDEKPTVTGGDVDADGWGGFVYGTYYGERYYIDGLAGYAKSDYDVRRRILIPSRNQDIDTIDETAKASPDSDDFTVSAGAGYDFVYGGLTYGPYARLTYLNVDLDDYTEKGAESSGLNLKVDGEDWTSFTSVLGGQFYYALSQPFGVIVPQGRVGWTHEFENESKNIKAVYVDDPDRNVLRARTDKPDRDYFELGVAVSAIFRQRVQVFFNYDTVLGLSDVTEHLFTLGGRWEF